MFADVPAPMSRVSVLQASNKRQHHLNKHLYRPSTFMTSYDPPVFMEDDEERSAYYGSLQDHTADDSVGPPSYRVFSFLVS